MRRLRSSGLSLLAAGALTLTSAVAFAQTDPHVVYGSDDRLDLFEVADVGIAAAAESVVMLVSRDQLDSGCVGAGDACDLTTTSYTGSFTPPLCSAEPFATQAVAGFCTGFLVAPDLVATAGHCIDEVKCANTAIVTGFRRDDGAAPAPDTELTTHFCECIVGHDYGDTRDWALFRLDAPMANAMPACLGTGARIGMSLAVMGHPIGLPLKVAAGASVIDVEADYFSAALDTYGGNSGSPVFDAATLEVAGVLARGSADFHVDGACTRSNICSQQAGCRGGFEESTHVAAFVESVPDQGCALCGRPLTRGPWPLATDCLFTLAAATGSRSCDACVCDLDNNGNVLASDALRCLSGVVGDDIELACPVCAPSAQCQPLSRCARCTDDSDCSGGLACFPCTAGCSVGARPRCSTRSDLIECSDGSY